MSSSANKRIAKNTLLLYIRMFFTMLVSLFTSRVVLRVLGVTDYGINNVVSGVVTMFTFMNGAMSLTTQRYLNYDIGSNREGHLKLVFRTAMQVHVIIAIFIFIVGESVGIWFIYNKLVFPPNRMDAAFWVFQFSVLSCVVNVISLPYDADIIAHEHMDAFAYISIFDVVMKLVIVYMLYLSPFDKLISYSFLILCVGLTDRAIYNYYCKRHFSEVNFSLKVDKAFLKEMSSFAGWNLWGQIASMLFTQGLNMLLNVFFGPVVNAARGIAVQVQGVVQGFVSNIQMAVNPQITQSYAQNNISRLHKLMFANSKFCFYLLFFLVLPISLEAYDILKVWLGIVPDHTIYFLRLILLITLIDALANPFIIANMATGHVKFYNAVCGGLLLMIVPVSYVVLKLGGDPESVYIVHGIIAAITQFVRIFIMRRYIGISMRMYLKKIVFPVTTVVVTSSIIPLAVYFKMNNTVVHFFVVCIMCVLCTSFSVYFLGLERGERSFLIEKVHAMKAKLFSNKV